MTEKEKMLAGLMYDSDDKELFDARQQAKIKCRHFNTIPPENRAERVAALKDLLGKTGEKVWIEQPFLCDYGTFIEVGEKFYANYNLVILDCAKVIIGDNVFIGPNVGIYTAAHPIVASQRNFRASEFAAQINIGNNVWIGGGVQICPGVTIGDNTVIGAGSVITKDIPANVVAAGVPCKVIRDITLDDLIPMDEGEV
ncbi:MAG: sugar O-acetyltransferase [Clostridia bacterium]|nr:sugar O-acetyltransferase [Clostridia bacterium]